MKNIPPHSPQPNARRKLTLALAFALCAALACAAHAAAARHDRLAPEIEHAFAQQGSEAERTNAERTYPREVRGYRVERATVRIRRAPEAAESDSLISLGTPRVAGITPLTVTIEIPVTVAPVEQGGEVELLVFEDMRVNGMPVTVEDYTHRFRLPNERPLLLPQPARIQLSAPRVLLGALGEWSASRETWPVTGRVYVCGRYRRFLFTFKRAVPVEINLSVPNPLRNAPLPPAS